MRTHATALVAQPRQHAAGRVRAEHAVGGMDVVTGSTQVLCPRLSSGEFDLVVGSSSCLQRWRELELEQVAHMHFACMVRFDHPLATRNAPLREFDVILRIIVRHTNAIYPLVSPCSDFAGARNHAALLGDAIEYPVHHITVAYAAGRPRSAAAVRFAELLRTHLASVT